MKIAGSYPLGNAARPITGFAGGKRLVLGPKEYLVRPAHHAGKVVTRQVMKEGWGGPHLDDTQRPAHRRPQTAQNN